jgi:hypothetical protein
VAAGETKTVRLGVPIVDLAYWDVTAGWVVEAIEYEVSVGRHTLDGEALRGVVKVM